MKRTVPSLRLRLLVLVTASLALAVVATVVAMAWSARDSLLAQAERDVGVLARVLERTVGLADQLPDEMEDVVAREMQTTASMLALYVAAAESHGEKPGQIIESLQRVVAEGTIAEVWVTDPQGHAYIHTLPGVDFTFSPDPREQPQASAFWPLLTGAQQSVVQPATRRELDQHWFKYVGVAGVDKPRIVQVGRDAGSIAAMRDQLGLNRLVEGLVRTNALEAIYIVDRGLEPLAKRERSGVAALDVSTAERALLAEVIRTGTVRTRIAPQGIDVFAPIRADQRGIEGAFLVRLPRDELDGLLRHQLRTSGLIGLLVLALGGALSYGFAGRLAAPIGHVTAAAARVQQGDFGGLDELDPVATHDDEVGRLAAVFKSMAREVANRERVLDGLVAQRTRELAEKNAALMDAQRHINDELENARAMQLAILPERFPSAPGCTGHARMVPATQMAGDFYDFIELPGGRIGLVMADVSGKGVPAAFFMAVARTNLRSLALESAGAAECLRRTNAVLCRQNPHDLFVTVFYAVLDPATGELEYANGGHNPPYLRHADGNVEPLGAVPGMGLGMFAEAGFGTGRTQLRAGDRLVMYTDGVTEAFDAASVAYGETRLVEVLARCAEPGPAAMLDAVLDDVARFAGGAPQSDDITLAVLGWRPAPPGGP
jgi:sigma-B regulation protein RsbU (phosphoserine phosphatase)